MIEDKVKAALDFAGKALKADIVYPFGDNGGVTWTPGHYVYADEDGTVIATKRLH